MSAPADRTARHHGRPGFALLLAIVTMVVVGICALALWHGRAGTARADTLRTATLQRGNDADSLLALGIDAIDMGAWRVLPYPGTTIVTHQRRAPGRELATTMTRLGWQSLLVRGQAHDRSGVARVQASADARLLVPLRTPMRLPTAAITSRLPWRIDPSATLGAVTTTAVERRCRDGVVPAATLTDSLPVQLDNSLVTLVDPDTVSAPLVGVFQLTRDRITRPLVMEGMVVSVTGLRVMADLQIVGVLVVQGSVQPAGGRLDVTGAVITRDSGGAGSVLGNGDRVRYDACAIRRAVERATRPAPAATWTIVGRF